MHFKSPQELLDAYSNGLRGSFCDPEDLSKLLSTLKNPLFGGAAPHLYGSGKGKKSLCFKSLLQFDPTFGPDEPQTTGDCVSKATKTAVDGTRACEIVSGDAEEFVARGATEIIYKSRGDGQQGMTCSAAARFMTSTGGILLRQNYPELGLNLTKYNASIGIQGNRPIDPKVLAEAKKHQVAEATMITTVEQARDALANGYCICVCSNVGFSSQRDKNGIARREGNWNHAMAWIGCDDSHDILNETIFLIQNSWGLWNNGPKLYDQPDGSFWIREADAAAMLSQNGAFVFSNVNGFPAREINWTLDEVF